MHSRKNKKYILAIILYVSVTLHDKNKYLLFIQHLENSFEIAHYQYIV